MRRIKIAQIGVNLNSHAVNIFQSLKKLDHIFEIVGYALPENERERIPGSMHIFEGYREMTVEEILNDPAIEAVAIETDEIYLTKYALLAAEHGKHMHMEKPGGRELPEFERLIQTMKETGKVFHTGYMYRYNPYVQELLTQIKNGELGEIISVEAQMNCSHPYSVRQWLSELPGGMMFYLGCHLIDLILTIQGQPERILPLNKCTGKEGVTAEDFGMAVLEYPHGVSFAKTSAAEKGGFLRRQLVVSGTKATVELRPLEYYAEDGLHTDRIICTEDGWTIPGVTSTMEGCDRYDKMIECFGKMVLGEMENPYTLDYELELYKTVLKCCGQEA